MDEQLLIEAYKYCTNNREQLLASALCGCFYCLKTLLPAEIDEWVDEDARDVGQTALCPKCGVDFVIGSAAGFPLTMDFLKQMEYYWFEN